MNQMGEIQVSGLFGLDYIHNGPSQSLLMQTVGELAYWYNMKEFKLTYKAIILCQIVIHSFSTCINFISFQDNPL